MTDDVCYSCREPLNWEDAYEDARGNTICGKCFDKLVMKAEAEGEGNR